MPLHEFIDHDNACLKLANDKGSFASEEQKQQIEAMVLSGEEMTSNAATAIMRAYINGSLGGSDGFQDQQGCAVIKRCIEAGADPNITSNDMAHNTPLLWLLMAKQPELAGLLITQNIDNDNKAFLEQKDTMYTAENTPLVLALKSGLYEPALAILNALPDGSPSITEADPHKRNYTPLHYAVSLLGTKAPKLEAKVVKKLVKKGADVNARTDFGDTAQDLLTFTGPECRWQGVEEILPKKMVQYTLCKAWEEAQDKQGFIDLVRDRYRTSVFLELTDDAARQSLLDDPFYKAAYGCIEENIKSNALGKVFRDPPFILKSEVVYNNNVRKAIQGSILDLSEPDIARIDPEQQQAVEAIRFGYHAAEYFDYLENINRPRQITPNEPDYASHTDDINYLQQQGFFVKTGQMRDAAHATHDHLPFINTSCWWYRGTKEGAPLFDAQLNQERPDFLTNMLGKTMVGDLDALLNSQSRDKLDQGRGGR